MTVCFAFVYLYVLNAQWNCTNLLSFIVCECDFYFYLTRLRVLSGGGNQLLCHHSHRNEIIQLYIVFFALFGVCLFRIYTDLVSIHSA